MNSSSGERSTKQPLSQVRYVFGFQERTASSEKVLVIQPISNSRLCGMRLHKESYDLPLCLLFRAVSAGELRLVTTRGNCLADRLFGGFDAIVQEECERRILADELSG